MPPRPPPALFRTLLALLLAMSVAGTAHAQTNLSRLGEFRVSTTTAGDQAYPRLAMDAQGNFVVVWVSPDSSGTGIFAQRYNAACSPIGSEFQVNRTNITNDQLSPAVAMAPDGRFVVVWQSGDGTAIVGQLFAADGTPKFANDFTASGTHSGYSPAVAMDPAGRFVVAWHEGSSGGERVWALQFSAAGTPVRGEFQVHTNYSPANAAPAVATNASGDFVIAWYADIAEGQTVFARAYFQDGTTKFGPARVSPVEFASHQLPSVALRDDGSFAIAWQEPTGLDGSGYGVYWNRSNATGTAITPARFLVNTATAGDQSNPSISTGPSGEFVVSYRSAGLDGNGDAAAAQRFDSTGVKVGSELVLNSFTAGNQQPTYTAGANAIDPQGNLLFVWQSAGQDGSGRGVYADKFYLANQGPPLSEFRVNTTTTGNQSNPCVAMNASGTAVIVWEGPVAGQNRTGVFLQRYNSAGQRIGTETLVAPNLSGSAHDPSVAICGTGESVVVFEADPANSGSPDIYLQTFDASGTATGSPTRVNAFYTADVQRVPVIAMAAAGNYVVVWESVGEDSNASGIFAQLYIGDAPSGGKISVNEAVQGDQVNPAVSMNAAGEFNIAWRSSDAAYQFGGGTGVFARRYRANGSAKGGEFLINNASPNDESYPSIALLDSGVFITTYQRDYSAGDTDLFAKIYTPDGTDTLNNPSELSLNSRKAGRQYYATISATADGRFRVAWSSDDGNPQNSDVYQRFFSAVGQPLDLADQLVNTFTAGEQRTLGLARQLAADSTGNYLIAWRSAGQDGDGTGIYAARLFAFPPPALTTTAATNVAAAGAALNGTVDPKGATVAVFFEWGATSSLGNSVSAGSLSGNGALPGSATLNGLLPGQTYYFRIGANSSGRIVTGQTLSFHTLGFTAPGAPPSSVGGLHITINPSTARWRLEGEADWRGSGSSATGLVEGQYTIEFEPIFGGDGSISPAPAPQTTSVVAGMTRDLTIDYANLGAIASVPGQLQVLFAPAAVTSSAFPEDRARWRVVGDPAGTWRDHAQVFQLPAGTYLIEFQAVPNYRTPAKAAIFVAAEEDSTKATVVSVGYEPLIAPEPGQVLPQALTFTQISTQTPYEFVGEVDTDIGTGSGTAVTRGVVLTAGHAVFDDAKQSFATGVRWRFQRARGQFEPQPLLPRGVFVFSGYAATRVGANPGESNAASREKDVAALWFNPSTAARSGASGYLVSDANTSWPVTALAKTLVGYPDEIDRYPTGPGRMHATPANTAAFNPDANAPHVFSSTVIAGAPGMSGGPLCVQLNDGNFYPAAVYLGGDSRCFVRVIDAEVDALIQLAQIYADDPSSNNTNGGSTLVNTGASVGTTRLSSAGITVTLNPPEARSAGAAWRLSSESQFRASGNSAPNLPAGSYRIIFKDVAGYATPTSATIGVSPSQLASAQATYTLLPPVITSAASRSGRRGDPLAPYDITATGIVSSLAVIGQLPTGLTFDANSGRIAGTPTVSGKFDVTLRATNSAGSDNAPFTLRVAPLLQNQSASVSRGQPLSYAITTDPADGAVTFTADPTAFPPALALTNGAVTGTPTVSGQFTVPITITNAGGDATANLTLNIGPGLTVDGNLSLTGTIGVSFAPYTISTTDAGVTYSATGLPPGLAINPQTGEITGTPTLAGTSYLATITATNAGGSASVQVEFVIMSVLDVSEDAGGTVSLGGVSISGKSDRLPNVPIALTAQANAGYYFAGWSGDLSARGTELAFNMPAVKTTVHATFRTIASLAGAYRGLCTAGERAGYLQFTVNASGVASGNIRFASHKYPFRAPFKNLGDLDTTAGLLSVALTADALSTPPQITSELTDTAGHLAGAARRVSVSAPLGKYALALPRPTAHTAAAGVAQGHGFGSLNVKKGGAVTFSGTLGDGTHVSAGGNLTEGGAWFLFAEPYAKKTGLLAGLLAFHDETEPNIDWLEGNLVWKKPAAGTAATVASVGSRVAPVSFSAETLTLSYSGITPALTKTVDLVANRFTLTPLDSTTVLLLNAATDRLSGRFGDSRTSLHGVLLPRQKLGFGQFRISAGITGALELKP